jgi:RNA polymerase sigma factor (sigma-70 family)
MSDETKLFAEFAATRSEAAFAGIIRLHANLVFATALRQLGDRGLAEEVTQSVFVILAQRADSLKSDATLAGWLYQTTLNQARQRLRSELRRQNREQIAAAVAASAREGDSIWAMLIPLLDEALLALGEKDRLAVILHFMEQRPFREVGRILGVGEDAARKRVNRVVSDLTSWFQQRGLAVPAATMIAALSLEGISAVALSAASILAAGASASAALAGSALPIFGILMSSTQLKLTVAVVALAIGVTTPFILRNRTAQLEKVENPSAISENPGANASARNPNLRTPTGSGDRQATAVPKLTPPVEKSFLERLNDGDMSLSMLSQEQADAFLALNKTNAASLLAAYRVTHDPEYLRKAATNYASDPAVLLRVAMHDAFPEERRAWLDQLKRTDPDNALAYYLSANQHWKDDDVDAALQDFATATQKSAFKDYLTDHMQTLEEIYLSAGHTAAEAKGLATHAVELPYIAQVVEMSRKMVDLMKQHQSSGDSASVENLTRMGLTAAGHLNAVQDGGNLLGQMVGVKVEQRFLTELDPKQNYAFLNGTVGERLSALATREQSIRKDSQFIGEWIGRATEQETVSYFDRLKLYGESAAIEWLKNRSTPQ